MSASQRLAILFGPQSSNVDEALSSIRTCVRENPSASHLVDIIRDLPSIWQTIQQAWPPLAQLNGEAQLAALARFFEGGPPPSSTKSLSILITPLTVLQHIVELYTLRKATSELQITDVQGFCVGFLAAISVASTHDETQFRVVLVKVIRLAVCIGALIDLNEIEYGRAGSLVVRWSGEEGRLSMNKVLSSHPGAYITCMTDTNRATITVPIDSERDVIREMANEGLSVRSIPLCGRFHHADHAPAVKQMIQLCNSDQRFRLPDGQSLTLPLRSNIDAEVVSFGPLHETALQAILCSQSKWHATVAAALDGMTTRNQNASLVAIGPEQCVPRMARARLRQTWGKTTVPTGMKILANGSMTPSRASSPADSCSEQVPTVQPIAITGMSCRYPQAASVEALWELLELGKCAVGPLPNERFKMEELLREPRGPFWGNCLEEPDVFDHRFFGISAREAATMDPQQRLLLQVAYEAVESAGYCGLGSTHVPDDVGCYVGVGSDDYTDNVGSNHANAYSAPGTLQAFNTGRISHYFGWSGPSVVVDTACSSAAVAIHLACQALHTRDCSVAVAGGVNVMTSPKVTQNLAAASFLSPTGASKAFDASADGYCRGEGAGLVVLRPLDQAMQNGDPILGIITGTAVNQGSNCSPITVPVSKSQMSLYRKALSTSGIVPEEVTYVEAHGTGTQVGDPIEMDSIRTTFGGFHRKQKLHVGSIKDNIGHTETSSGVAGLIKTILMLQKQRIPKQANFTQLNPKIPALNDDNMAIPTSSIDWEATARVAMVTNYGAAGSNSSIVVRQPFTYPSSSRTKLSHAPIFVAAKSPESLRSYCDSLLQYLRQAPSPTDSIISDYAYNLAIKQNRTVECFTSFSTDGLASLTSQLAAAASGAVQVQSCSSDRIPVILCFGGQNGNTVHISQELVSSSRLLQSHLADCDRACQSLGLPSLFPTIFKADPIHDLVSLHCILFAIHYASAKSWIDSGLQVDQMIGHSFGQLTALCVAGGMTLVDGIRFISERARLLQTHCSGKSGIMMSIDSSEAELRDIISRTRESVDVACFNGPRSHVLAGEEGAIQAVERTAFGFKMQRLANTHAFHSRMMDPIVSCLREVAESITFRPTTVPVEACSQDLEWPSVEADQLVAHTREPVYFESAVRRIDNKHAGGAIWLEAGSASPVIPMIRRVLETSQSHIYQPIDLRGPQAMANLSKATSALWAKGTQVQFWPFHKSQSSSYNCINLPPYQFTKTRHWTDYNPLAFMPTCGPIDGESATTKSFVQIIRQQPGESLFLIDTDDELYQNCTKGHAVVNQNLCPASLYLEIVVNASSQLSTIELSATMPHLQNLCILAPLVLNPSGQLQLKLSRDKVGKNQWAFSLFTLEGQSSTVHATGTIWLHPVTKKSTIVSRFRSLNRLMTPSKPDSIENSPRSSGLKGPAVYHSFRRVVNYADYYRGVDNLTKRSSCDPILIDNFVQVAGVHVNCLSEFSEDEVYVCSAVGEIFIGEAFMQRDCSSALSWRVYSNYDRVSRNQVACDVFVMNQESGQLAIAIMAATFTGVSIRALTRTLARLNNQQSDAPEVDTAPLPQDISKADVTSATAPASAPTTIKEMDNLPAVQRMLSDLLGVGLEELGPSCSLLEIGVDSLMSTEVLTEIKKRFSVNITSAALSEIPDIGGLVQVIFPGSSVASKPVTAVPGQDVKTAKTATSTIPEELSMLVQEAHDAFAAIRSTIDYSQETKWTRFCDSVFPKQMALVTAYVLEAFQALGHPLQSLRGGENVPLIPVLPQHEKVRSQFYAVLEFSRLVSRTADARFIRTKQQVPIETAADLHDEIIRQFPHHASEHLLLRTTGSQLAACLSGDANPLALLFQDSEARRLMGDVYTNAPMFKSATMHLAGYLQGVLERVGSGRVVKILEIGAGTGGTTRFLVSQIAARGVAFEYTFTDISSSLVALARKGFKQYGLMRYMTLNIEQDPPQELLGQYDIIISTNCIHATRNIEHSCGNIRKMLRPDGILCLIELTRNLFWFDLVFGLLEGWWLFDDGRKHALANEYTWNATLQKAGYRWIDWSRNDLKESEFLRLIVASPSKPEMPLVTEETVMFEEKDGLPLLADIYYPSEIDDATRRRPIALLIHGGGHIMLSRKDIRVDQNKLLLDAGFLPVSIDYRLCPETTLTEGPMRDARDALRWARQVLPSLPLQRPDIRPNGNQVVSIGWSTGGHLAMSLSWTAAELGIAAPEAVLSFYCPTDYTDPFWSQPNFPFGKQIAPPEDIDIGAGISSTPITVYNPPRIKKALGGWMSTTDPRSQIALHMNWKGQTIPVLLNAAKALPGEKLPRPTKDEVALVCPTAQTSAGHYRSPTFIIHGSLDDLIPISQVRHTAKIMKANGVDVELRELEGSIHLFDIAPTYGDKPDEVQAVADGIRFLRDRVQF
ncbi:putative polyketide synthase [Aspergillus stella-maris]|uniref:putative polyketide synthase n=1 Tax=Aspergillus stella-maris TaxID=1810926 RepID=UPI003CCDDD9E